MKKDNAGHVKIEMTSGTYDSSGKKVPNDDKHVWAWNGVSETHFSQRSGSLGSATIKDTPRIAIVYWHPWRNDAVTCEFLEETIAAEKQVSVDELKDGTYRITFDYKTSRIEAVIDPSQGYTCSIEENYNEQGQLRSRDTAKYEEVAKRIWFPVSGQTERYTDDGSLRGKNTFKSSQIRINDPSFNENHFDVNDVPVGKQLAKQANQLKKKGLTVVAVQASKIDENALNKWVKDNSIPFPVGMIRSDEEKIRFTWGVKSLPWLILTDSEHIVHAEGFALNELTEKLKQVNEQ